MSDNSKRLGTTPAALPGMTETADTRATCRHSFPTSRSPCPRARRTSPWCATRSAGSARSSRSTTRRSRTSSSRSPRPAPTSSCTPTPTARARWACGASIDGRSLSLVVVDRGRGIVPRARQPRASASACRSSPRWPSRSSSAPGDSEETEVRMTFDLGGAGRRRRGARVTDGATANEAVVRIRSGPLVGAGARARRRHARRARPVPDRPPRRRHPAHRRRRRPRAGARPQRPRPRRGRRRRRAPRAARVRAAARRGAAACWPTATCPGVGNVFERVADDVAGRDHGQRRRRAS